ncbi:MAG: ribosome recycling factor [Candidatus Saccharimonadia bacterium]
MTTRDLVNSTDPKMAKAVEHLRDELNSLRTGRASVVMVDGIVVDYYGQSMQLKQLATIGTPDARTLAITPWDHNAMDPIEKAIRDTQSLGLTPNNDGHTIRLNIPPMTEERRKEVVKSLGEKIENTHVTLRNIRHEVLNEVKKLEKDKQATQDDVKFAEQELNRKIDNYRITIEEIEKAKTAEIMQV